MLVQRIPLLCCGLFFLTTELWTYLHWASYYHLLSFHLYIIPNFRTLTATTSSTLTTAVALTCQLPSTQLPIRIIVGCISTRSHSVQLISIDQPPTNHLYHIQVTGLVRNSHGSIFSIIFVFLVRCFST